MRDGPVKITLREQRVAKVDRCLCVIWTGRQRLFVVRNGFIQLPGFEECRTEIVVRFRICRVDQQHFLIVRNCIVEIAARDEKTGEVVVRFGIIRPKRDRLTVMSDCFTGFGTVAQRNAEVVMRHPAAGVFFERRCV